MTELTAEEQLRKLGPGGQAIRSNDPYGNEALQAEVAAASPGKWRLKFLQGAPWEIETPDLQVLFRAMYAGPNGVDLANARLAARAPTLAKQRIELVKVVEASPCMCESSEHVVGGGDSHVCDMLCYGGVCQRCAILNQLREEEHKDAEETTGQ